MGKIVDTLRNMRTFLVEVVVEMRRCTWPGKRELLESTIVVLVSLLLLGLYVGICDRVLHGFIKLLVHRG
ncbi:MAG: preprotein translocase subunit SecE [Kiritimatiellae bacterium]|nr:preprotein translocase subunit SecE [Kiritimatiellia bacterium]